MGRAMGQLRSCLYMLKAYGDNAWPLPLALSTEVESKALSFVTTQLPAATLYQITTLFLSPSNMGCCFIANGKPQLSICSCCLCPGHDCAWDGRRVTMRDRGCAQAYKVPKALWDANSVGFFSNCSKFLQIKICPFCSLHLFPVYCILFYFFGAFLRGNYSFVFKHFISVYEGIQTHKQNKT